jgi:Bacterial protein of unknown function (DUF922)
MPANIHTHLESLADHLEAQCQDLQRQLEHRTREIQSKQTERDAQYDRGRLSGLQAALSLVRRTVVALERDCLAEEDPRGH